VRVSFASHPVSPISIAKVSKDAFIVEEEGSLKS
jgi:hypothetical protein